MNSQLTKSTDCGSHVTNDEAASPSEDDTINVKADTEQNQTVRDASSVSAFTEQWYNKNPTLHKLEIKSMGRRIVVHRTTEGLCQT